MLATCVLFLSCNLKTQIEIDLLMMFLIWEIGVYFILRQTKNCEFELSYTI